MAADRAIGMVALAACISLLCCSDSTSSGDAEDGVRDDAPVRDGAIDAPVRDGAIDSTSGEAQADASSTDAPSTDLAIPDVAVDRSVDLGPPSCTDRYGAAPGFQLCDETLVGCTFYALANGTCGALCAQYGGWCQYGWKPTTTCQPRADADYGCAISNSDLICLCSR